MTVSLYASRYARALFRIASREKELSLWQSDLRKIDSLLKEQPLVDLLKNRQVSWEEKSGVLAQRLGQVRPQILKLLSFLVEKDRLNVVSEIDEEYQRLVDAYRGIEGVETVDVTTAIPLDADYQLKLAQRITEIIGKPVVVKTKVDPAIIGGIVIQVRDRLIDGSISSKLAALKNGLSGVAR